MKKLLILSSMLITSLLIGASYFVLAGGPVLDRPHRRYGRNPPARAFVLLILFASDKLF